jgi:hypothetical protein
MPPGVVGGRSGSRLAIGWQEAGVEGILTDVDADPGGRGGMVVRVHGVVVLILMNAG